MSAAHDHGAGGCRDLLERLSEYIDGELPPEIFDEIERHVADCEPCVRFIRSLRNTVAHVSEMPRPHMPEEMKRACVEAYARKCRGN